MYNRIEIPVCRQPVLALILNLPWLMLALFCLLAASHLPEFWYSAGMLAMIIAAWRTVRHLRPGGSLVTGLLVDHDRLQIRYRDGRMQVAEVAPESRLGARLSILKLVPEAPTSSPVPVILSTLPGVTNTEPQAFRRLRVWLRLGGTPKTDRSPQAF